jgi:predicted regulator of Ras-like GTPase activity (Roadblock/LC7/MglB family)
MIEFPEGKSLGWMQAPPSWIGSHTVRFIGIVRVVIQDGEGYILIKKGKPLYHYFRHGTIELKGHSALDYFNSHPIIEFDLCKYTPEELSIALKLCNIEDLEPVPLREPEKSGPVVAAQNPPSHAADIPETSTARDARTPDLARVSPEETPVEEKPVIPQPVVIDEPDLHVIAQIKNLNGIVAVSVFDGKRNVMTVGEADSEAMVRISKKMLDTAQKVTHLLPWGSFVHLTLQIPEGNMIIAPYGDNYLCLLTTRTINIGHIRRILRELQQQEVPHPTA